MESIWHAFCTARVHSTALRMFPFAPLALEPVRIERSGGWAPWAAGRQRSATSGSKRRALRVAGKRMRSRCLEE